MTEKQYISLMKACCQMAVKLNDKYDVKEDNESVCSFFIYDSVNFKDAIMGKIYLDYNSERNEIVDNSRICITSDRVIPITIMCPDVIELLACWTSSLAFDRCVNKFLAKIMDALELFQNSLCYQSTVFNDKIYSLLVSSDDILIK
jgi:hypothetical protein